MRLLTQWFSRAADRLERVRFIEDALLTHRYARYAFFRLRYFFGISVAEAVVHIIEFTILAFIFTRQTLILAILMRVIGNLGSAWWWGVLEGMRGEIRALRREHKSYRIDTVASKWLCLAVMVAALLMVGSVGWIVFDTSRPMRGFTVFHLFVLAIAVQLALSILSRTYHSIVYAVRRVYRPFLAILGVRMFAFVGTVAFWPLFGHWSFPLMLLATSGFASGLTFHYVRRMYRTLGLKPLHIRFNGSSLRLLRLLARRETALAGFAYVVLRLDTLIILLLFPRASSNPSTYNLFLFFYLISPLVHSAYGWAHLFYFDLKRLETGLLINLKRDFERFVRRLAWWVGSLFGVVACLIGTLLVGRNLGMLYLLLMLFFLCRSRLAFSQIRFFAEHRYGTLIALGGALIVAVAYAQAALPNQAQRFGFYTVALTVVMLATAPIAVIASGRRPDRGMLSLLDWMTTVRALDGRVRIRGVRFARNATDFQIAQVVRRIEQGTKRLGAVTRIGRGRVAWFETGSGAPSDESLIIWSGGLIRSVNKTEAAPNGIEALTAAQRLGMIDAILPASRAGKEGAYDIPTLLRRFQGTFPTGMVFDLKRDGGQGGCAPSPAECRDIMFQAIRYSKDFSSPGRGANFDVSTLLVDGEIRLIFAIPMGSMGRARRQWRRQIKKINLALACGAKIRA